MRFAMRSLGIATVLALLTPVLAQAQVRNFTRQQQASLLIYQQQIAAQQRIQQQMQMQVLRQQMLNQQQQLSQTQRMQQQTFDLLVDPNDPNVNPQDLAMTRRGTSVFGQMHFNSSLFNRTGPYYNYQFVSRRNRPVPIGLNNNRGLPTNGIGGIIFGNNFGLVFPY